MRVSVIVLCLVLAGASSAAGQVTGGVKAGANFSTLRFEDDGPEDVDEFKTRTGLVAGVFFTVPVAANFDVQPEVLFSMEGAKVEEGEFMGTLKMNYLDVPILFRYNSDRSGVTSFQIFGGPSFGFNLSAKSVFEFDGEEETEDFKDEVETLDVGVVVGAGVEVGRLTLDGRYTWGLSNINASEEDPDIKIKNRAFAILLGIRF